jgi:hypothetical protein
MKVAMNEIAICEMLTGDAEGFDAHIFTWGGWECCNARPDPKALSRPDPKASLQSLLMESVFRGQDQSCIAISLRHRLLQPQSDPKIPPKMHQLKWSEREKKIARAVFNAALQQELAEVVTKFKAQAERVQTPDELWPLADWLAQQRRHVDERYDFRYSQLILVFAGLLREGHITRSQLDGLAPDKLAFIDGLTSL